MNSLFQTIWATLLNQSIQITLVFAAIYPLTLISKKASSHFRHLLWLVVIVKCVTPPLLSLPVNMAWINIFEADNQVASTAYVPPIPPATLETGLPATPDTPATPATPASAAMTTQKLNAGLPSNNTQTINKDQNISLSTWITCTWMLIATVMLFYSAVMAIAMRRRLRSTRRQGNNALQTEANRISKLLGIKKTPPVWTINRFGQPFVFGMPRGEVYLPENYCNKTGQNQITNVLAHELVHIARGDSIINALQIIVQGLYFFHPLVWYANSQLRREREKGCDETVIASLNSEREQYGRAILDSLISQRRSVPALAVAGPARNIEERIRNIMNSTRLFTARPSKLSLATAVILALGLLPLTVTPAKAKDMVNIVSDTNLPELSTEELLIRAWELVFKMEEGKFEAATAGFDKQMKRSISAKQLGDVWHKLEYVGGKFKGYNEPYFRIIDGYDTVFVPCFWERNKLDFQVVFNSSGEISGLWTQEADKFKALPSTRKIHKMVNELVNDGMDLSTPEAAMAAYHMAFAMKKPEAIHKLGWHKYGAADIQNMQKSFDADKNNQMSSYWKNVEIIEVWSDNDNFSEVIAKFLTDSDQPYTIRSFGKICGIWRNLGENRTDSLQEARKDIQAKLVKQIQSFSSQFSDATRKVAAIDRSTPKATAQAYTKAMAEGDTLAAAACMAPDSHDISDTVEITLGLKPKMKMLFDAVDPNVGITGVQLRTDKDKTTIKWNMPLRKSITIKGRVLQAGSSFEMDGTISKHGDVWLFDGI